MRTFGVLAVALATACVPMKKYEALETVLSDERTAREAAETDLKGRLTAEEARTAELTARVAEQERLLAQKDASYAELLAVREALAKDVERLTDEKARMVADRRTLEASVAEMEEALAEMAERKAAADRAVRAYHDLVSRFQSLIDAGRLQVKIVDGRMVVQLATDVLFSSGSATLSEEGKAAIAEVGAVLAGIPDRRYQVEGHTDDVPIRTDRFPSNWELASARALTVVRSLVEAGVPASNVSGASFAETRPVAPNKTPEGRTQNRRIEIVVVPDLSQLPGTEELEAAAKAEATP